MTSLSLSQISGEDVVKITGTREQVNKAKAAVNKILVEQDTPAYAKLAKGEVSTFLRLGFLKHMKEKEKV